MESLYITPDAGTTVDRAGPASFRRRIEAVKDGVRIEDAATHYGEFRLAGAGRLCGRCVSPDHEDKTPSMHVYTDDQRFKCYGCGEYGDVLDLVMLAEGCELWVAMVELANRHGVELPERPPSWYARQKRQATVRDRIDAEKVEHVRMLVFRLIWMPWLRRLPGWAREEATESAWAESRHIALRLYEQRRGA